MTIQGGFLAKSAPDLAGDGLRQDNVSKHKKEGAGSAPSLLFASDLLIQDLRAIFCAALRFERNGVYRHSLTSTKCPAIAAAAAIAGDTRWVRPLKP